MIASRDLKLKWLIWAILVCSLISGVFLGCGSVKEKKLEKEGLTLIYRPKSQVGSEVEKMRLNHPINISEEEFENHLYSLQYEELSLLGKKKYVLSIETLEENTRLLTKAVNRMTPENILIFDMETPRGSTRGEVFAIEDKINFRFDAIKGIEFSGNSFAGVAGSAWRLVPMKGQRFQVVKKLLGSSSKENWIVAEMKLPNISRRLVKRKKTENIKAQNPKPISQSAPPPQPAKNQPSVDKNLEKKLKFLKGLRKKNLIDDGEYEKKRKELLNSYL